MTYKVLIRKSIELNEKLQFKTKAKINESTDVTDTQLDTIGELIQSKLLPSLIVSNPGYWGASCQHLSTEIYAFLTAAGIKSDIIYGEVNINGTNEFDTTIDGLIEEYNSEILLDTPQPIHAWVSIGGDTIIDACLPDRLAKYYGIPRDQLPDVFIGRADFFKNAVRSTYIPMLIGIDFLAKTNPPNPDYSIDKYKVLFGQ